MALVYWIRRPEHVDIFSEGYVGVTSRELVDRVAEHLKVARLECKGYSVLHSAINSIGIDNLICEVVVISDEDYAYDLEEKLRPDLRIGWNLAKGGSKPPSKLGFSHSEESKLKISAIWKGKKRTPENIAKSSESRKGFKHSEETRKLLSEQRTGLKRPGTGSKISASNTGKTRTDSQKRFMSDQVMNRHPWDRSGVRTDTWLIAMTIYGCWLEGLTMTRISENTNSSRSTIKRMFDLFNDGYVPIEDSAWLEWVEDFNKKEVVNGP